MTDLTYQKSLMQVRKGLDLTDTAVNLLHGRRVTPSKEKDACQVVGTLEINKVAGNFHITAGDASHSLTTLTVNS